MGSGASGGSNAPADDGFLGAPDPMMPTESEPDRSMFGEQTFDLSDEGVADVLDLDSNTGPIGGEIPLGATPPGVAGLGGAPPPLGGMPSAIPQDAPSMFDTSSFVPHVPVGPPPEAYDRFDERYFQENLALLPDVAQVHGSRNKGDNSAIADEFFQVERAAPQTNEPATNAGFRPPTTPKKS